jgi:hypothetical protein
MVMNNADISSMINGMLYSHSEKMRIASIPFLTED